MSQPIHARTTGGARKPRNASPSATPTESMPAPEAVTPTDSVGAPGGRPHDDVGAPPLAAPASLDNPLAPETLARTLRAVAAELERDPALARRVAAAVAAAVAADSTSGAPAAPYATEPPASSDSRVGTSGGSSPEVERSNPSPVARLNRTFRPKLVTGASPDLGSGIPDPFALHQRLGADGFRAALDELRLGTLRAIVREHGLDPKGALSRQNDAAKLRAAILAATTKTRR